MTITNVSNFTFNQTIKSLSDFAKKLKETCCSVPHRTREYDLEMVLVDWDIKCPLMKHVVATISQTNEKPGKTDGFHLARTYLRFLGKRNQKIKSEGTSEDFKEYLIYFEPQMSPWDLIADWDLPYHQGRVLEYIYQSLFRYGKERGDILRDAEHVLDHYISICYTRKSEK